MLDVHRIAFIFQSSVELFLLKQTSDVQVGTPGCFSTGAGGDTCVQSQVGELRETDYGVIVNVQTSSHLKVPHYAQFQVHKLIFGKMLNA